jgi:hypothetical protein
LEAAGELQPSRLKALEVDAALGSSEVVMR